MNKKPIRILIVDDHVVVRKGIRALLATESGLDVIGEAEDGFQAVEMYDELNPDLLLLDLLMPKMTGIQAIKKIREKHPDAKILVLTSFAADDQVFPAIKAGALGYLLKDTDPEDLVNAIHQVYQGESFLSPTIARKVLEEVFQSSGKPLISRSPYETGDRSPPGAGQGKKQPGYCFRSLHQRNHSQDPRQQYPVQTAPGQQNRGRPLCSKRRCGKSG